MSEHEKWQHDLRAAARGYAAAVLLGRPAEVDAAALEQVAAHAPRGSVPAGKLLEPAPDARMMAQLEAGKTLGVLKEEDFAGGPQKAFVILNKKAPEGWFKEQENLASLLIAMDLRGVRMNLIQVCALTPIQRDVAKAWIDQGSERPDFLDAFFVDAAECTCTRIVGGQHETTCPLNTVRTHCSACGDITMGGHTAECLLGKPEAAVPEAPKRGRGRPRKMSVTTIFKPEAETSSEPPSATLAVPVTPPVPSPAAVQQSAKPSFVF